MDILNLFSIYCKRLQNYYNKPNWRWIYWKWHHCSQGRKEYSIFLRYIKNLDNSIRL